MKKSKAGRKKLSPHEKKKQISIYIREKDIARHGGEDQLKNKFINLAQSE